MPWLRATRGLTLIAALGACGNQESTDDVQPPPEAAPVVVIDAAPPPFPVVPIGDDELGEAVSAWDAVVERHRYLARRNQKGAVTGAFAGTGEHGHHLRDLEAGEGMLAIQVALPDEVEVPRLRKVVVWGSWVASEAGQWVWKASKLGVSSTRVPAPKYSPGLSTAEPRPLPDGARGPDEVGDGEVCVFVVRERPAKVGDGWGVSRVDSTVVVARVVLPGERGAYGGQDMRTKGERWRLGRGGRYQVHIRKAYRFDNKVDVLFATGKPAGVLR